MLFRSTMKDEYHKPYFDTLYNLLGYNKKNHSSFIAEHMLFNKEIMKELINDISRSNIKGILWYEKIINASDISVSYNAFSEFETYGTFCVNKYPNFYIERKLNNFRHGGYIAGRLISKKRLNKLSFDLDSISLEFNHYPPYPLGLICKILNKFISLLNKILK